jgi:hypothetical protein
MSHRVTTETEMKDARLLAQAAKTAGVTFTESSGGLIHFTGGLLGGAILNLKTGQVSGDSDYGHTTEVLGGLRQAYGEAKYKAECIRQGIQIESRTVDREGNIVLMCAMG